MSPRCVVITSPVEDKDCIKELQPKQLSATTKPSPTTLVRAAGEGKLEQVVEILDSYGNVNVKTLAARGTTPLHEAAKGGHLAVVRELLRRGVDTSAVNKTGSTALHFAALCKDKHVATEITRHLLDAQANVSTLNKNMDSALHFAAYCPPTPGCDEVLRLLVARQADVNARNRNRDTPVMNACLHDNVAAVHALVELGADTSYRNLMDKNVNTIAAERKHPEMQKALEVLMDPMHQLNAVTGQMKQALHHMQTCDTLSKELQRTSVAREAYEQCAHVLAAELLDNRACIRIAVKAIGELRDLEEQSPAATMNSRFSHNNFNSHGSSPPPSVGSCLSTLSTAVSLPAYDSFTPTCQKFMQVLCLLLLVSRNEDGSEVLDEIGVCELFPVLERYTRELKVGEKELRELKINLSEFLEEDGFHGQGTASHVTCGSMSSKQRSLASVHANARRMLQDLSSKKTAGNREDRFTPEQHFSTSFGANTPFKMPLMPGESLHSSLHARGCFDGVGMVQRVNRCTEPVQQPQQLPVESSVLRRSEPMPRNAPADCHNTSDPWTDALRLPGVVQLGHRSSNESAADSPMLPGVPQFRHIRTEHAPPPIPVQPADDQPSMADPPKVVADWHTCDSSRLPGALPSQASAPSQSARRRSDCLPAAMREIRRAGTDNVLGALPGSKGRPDGLPLKFPSERQFPSQFPSETGEKQERKTDTTRERKSGLEGSGIPPRFPYALGVPEKKDVERLSGDDVDSCNSNASTMAKSQPQWQSSSTVPESAAGPAATSAIAPILPSVVKRGAAPPASQMLSPIVPATGNPVSNSDSQSVGAARPEGLFQLSRNVGSKGKSTGSMMSSESSNVCQAKVYAVEEVRSEEEMDMPAVNHVNSVSSHASGVKITKARSSTSSKGSSMARRAKGAAKDAGCPVS